MIPAVVTKVLVSNLRKALSTTLLPNLDRKCTSSIIGVSPDELRRAENDAMTCSEVLLVMVA